MNQPNQKLALQKAGMRVFHFYHLFVSSIEITDQELLVGRELGEVHVHTSFALLFTRIFLESTCAGISRTCGQRQVDRWTEINVIDLGGTAAMKPGLIG